MIRTVTTSSLAKRTCPKCGHRIMRIKRACCAERRRGIKAYAKCRKCGYRETIR